MNDHFAPADECQNDPMPDAFDIIGKLRLNQDFDSSECDSRQPFDADRIDGFVCCIVAGSTVPVDAEMLAGWAPGRTVFDARP